MKFELIVSDDTRGTMLALTPQSDGEELILKVLNDSVNSPKPEVTVKIVADKDGQRPPYQKVKCLRICVS